jgi:hypothetical protein
MLFSEILVAFTSLIFSLFLFIGSRRFPPSRQAGVPGTAFFPTIISCLIFTFALIQIINIIRKYLISSKNNGNEHTTAQDFTLVQKKVLHIAGIIALMLFYSFFWLFNIGHFLVNSIIIFLPIAFLFGGTIETNWWKLSIFIVILLTFIYSLFKLILRVPI